MTSPEEIWDESCPEIPARIVLAGSSGTGKTHFLVNLLKRKNQPFKEVYIVAPVNSLRQKAYKSLASHFDGLDEKERPELFPIENLPNEELRKAMMEAWSDTPEVPKLVIIDDLLSDISRENDASRWVQVLYTSGRHINISVVSLVQNPFPSGYGRTERLNSTLLGIWSFPDVQCIDRMLTQICDSKKQQQEAGQLYRSTTAKVGGCLLIDLTARRRGEAQQMFRIDELENYADI